MTRTTPINADFILLTINRIQKQRVLLSARIRIICVICVLLRHPLLPPHSANCRHSDRREESRRYLLKRVTNPLVAKKFPTHQPLLTLLFFATKTHKSSYSYTKVVYNSFLIRERFLTTLCSVGMTAICGMGRRKQRRRL
jgi:hypothetical protein